MVLASRGFAPLRTFSGGIGAGRRRLTLPAPSSSALDQNVVSAPPAQSPSFIAAPTNPSDRRHRPLPSSLPSQNATSSTGRSPVCACVPSFEISAHRLMSTTSAAARYFEGPWYEKYLMLEEYKKKHGNCLVPRSHLIGDVKLGRWVHDQRQLYKKGKLSANRREKLDALGFSWDPLADTWEQNFALLEQFREREGHSNVPKTHEEDGVQLGSWLGRQRLLYKNDKLDESYQQRLENLGMSWDPLADQWERNYGLLEQYKEREGHCDVPYKYEESGVNLGVWVVKQRQLSKKGKLDESYQRRLENLGLRWDPLADQWERNFALLEQFEEREGHIDVIDSHEEDGTKLGQWVSWQRHMYKKGKLDESYEQRLENLGVSWDPLAEQWERSFALLEQYKKREDHCNVPDSHEEDGVQLGHWVGTQRQQYKKGKLDESYHRRLENLGVRLDPLAFQWEHNFGLLQQYKEREGHVNVSKDHVEDEVKLGAWLNRQRQLYKKGKLDVSYQQRLENLGMSWDPLADKWERNFALLEEFKERECHIDVPWIFEENGIKLGAWLNRQRQLYKKGKLDVSYQQRLENRGMSWDPLTEQWERSFALLEQYKGREGHCVVPRKYEEEGVQLGGWVGTQRKLFKKGKLDESYQRRLENLGLSWDRLADQWERNFALLEQFKEREVHSNVPNDHVEDGAKLGTWINTQRQDFKKGRLDESYQQRLEAAGVSWDPFADQWESNFALLEKYKEREGRIDVPWNFEENGIKLGGWVGKQRQLYKKGKMDESYQRRLENLGMSWDPLVEQWERNYGLLELYKEKEGHSNVPALHEEDGVKLGQWLDRQRQIRKGNRAESLSLERIERLDKVGMRW